MQQAKTLIQQRITVQLENISSYILKDLYNQYQLGDSCDVIVKTGREKHESFCHKVVLAFSSDLLRNVLSNIEPGKSPVLLLPDVNSDIIDYLMVFMYCGEVRISSDKYKDFVDACKILQLKGMNWKEEEHEEMLEEHMEESIEVGQENLTETEHKGLHFVDDDNTLEVESEYSENIEILTEHDDMEPDFIEDEYIDSPVLGIQQPSLDVSNHSKVRLKPEFIKSPFDAANVFHLPKSTKKQSSPKIINKNMPMQRDPQQRILLDDSNINIIREKLVTNILNVYKGLDLKLKDVQLIVKDNKLQKGAYNCSLCNKMISVVYSVDKKGKFRQWVNSNLKRHVIRAHQKEGK